MGGTRNSGRGVAFAVWLAVMLTGVAAEAKDNARFSTGPVVAIVGDGGKIKAAGASVSITGTASRVDVEIQNRLARRRALMKFLEFFKKS